MENRRRYQFNNIYCAKDGELLVCWPAGPGEKSANDFANYLPAAKERALLMAGHVRHWLMACTALSVLTAWVFLLWTATLTERYKDVVWGGLKPLL